MKLIQTSGNDINVSNHPLTLFNLKCICVFGKSEDTTSDLVFDYQTFDNEFQIKLAHLLRQLVIAETGWPERVGLLPNRSNSCRSGSGKFCYSRDSH